MNRFERDIDKQLADIAEGKSLQADGVIETLLVSSQAISLKRIADTLDEFLKLAKDQI